MRIYPHSSSASISLVSAGTSITSFIAAHGATVLGVVGAIIAIASGVYSLRATYLTNKLRKLEISKLQKDKKHGRHHTSVID